MNAKYVRSEIKSRLRAAGIHVVPNTPADRSIAASARFGAEVATSGKRLVRVVEKAVAEAAENVRAAIHDATRPPKRR